ncbi:PREDICTED: uncharacterized protein LOC106298129 [Brassica oleracea var. oleracea]|uniref:uncharacterized protein LOC106298129 n=1 Tax=Brassica oleracea var. oleracea TaxID=109376 RepID=UPI0006A7004D|nr:PREDICTED: uncharacterized protein LOC106298129 [Brassica oleracea var. oleracea]
MASSDVVLGHSTFDALRLGRSAQMIVGRLLRFWDSKNIKKQGEFMGITLLFLDEKNSVIHGFIPAGRAPFYRPSLRAGSVVRVSRFEVARCTNMYKITDHPFVIRFIPQTTIAEVIENAPVINVEKFMLRSFDPLQALANTNLELPDVVGQIHKEIEKSGATLHCNRCFNSNITGVVRYRVELLVDDGNNYAIVVVLNKEMLKLTKQDAANLLLNEVISKPQTLIKTVAITQISIQLQVNSGVNGKLPKCIEELEGQTFIFHIRVSPSNSASSRCPFTVSAISGQITTEDFNNNETPDTVRKFGEASTSDSASNTSTVEVEQGGRKDALE